MSYNKFIQQADSMDCGPSCLAMIAKHYGRQADREQLRKICSLGKDGVSLLGISKAAEAVDTRSVAQLTPAARFPFPQTSYYRYWYRRKGHREISCKKCLVDYNRQINVGIIHYFVAIDL
jgi:ABC-type bacteriocin/lantibiotic exporter with double-glycine peptidase domain